MQTFLPYRDFERSAAVLHSPRLGKQRVEALQVLRALELGEYGRRSHPVVRMWRGRTEALVGYGLAVVRARWSSGISSRSPSTAAVPGPPRGAARGARHRW